MSRAHWLLAAGLSAIAIVAMAVVTARSEPGTPDSPGADAAAEPVETPPAVSASSASSGCTDQVSPAGEDDEGLDVEEITAKVERIRELEFADEPEVDLVSVEELDQRLADEVERQLRPSVAHVEERVLKLLGAIPADADLYDFYASGLEGQVAGIYVPETKELLVVQGEDPGALERITLAHELQHALADDRLEIPFDERVDFTQQDADLAELALVEGDATLLMEFYALKHVGLGDLFDLGGSASFAESDEELTRLPYHLQRELLWPYSDGARFVCSLYRRGGWAAVDRAYDETPRSSDQILFPERYGETPADPAPSGSLPPPWTERRTAELGAATLLWLFEAPGGDPERALPDPRGSAAAWAGGESTLWTDGNRSALGISLAERDSSDPALCAAVAAWYVATRPEDEPLAFSGDERLVLRGADQAAVLRCPPGQVRLGIAPDLALAARLAAG